jgi:phage-related protein
MPLGEEVGDAYIEVHADTSSFRRELQREARAAGQAAGRDFGSGMDSELDDQMSRLGRRLRRSLTDAGVRSGVGFSEGLEDAVVRRMRRFTSNLQESMVSGDWARVLGDFDSLDAGMTKVEARLFSLREQGAITEDQFQDATKSLERWFAAVKNDEAEQALQRMSKDINGVGKEFSESLDSVNRELDRLAKNRAAKRLRRDLDLSDFDAQMKKINDGALKDFTDNVDAVGEGFREIAREGDILGRRLESQLAKKKFRIDVDMSDWDKEFQAAIAAADKAQAQLAINAGEHERKITEDLAREYRARRELNEDFINDRAEFWDREVSRAVDSEKALRRWARNAEKEMARLRKSLVTKDMDWLDMEALDRSLARFADNVDRSFSRAGRSINRGFIGRLRGARNDFANLVGVVGGGLERVFMKGFEAAFGAAGRAVESLGSKITNLGGPFSRVGDSVQAFGSAIQTMSGGPIGQLVVTLAGFGLTLQFLVPVLGTVVAGIYGLSGALTALAVSLGGAALGAILSLGPMLLAVGAGASAAVIGVLGMTDAMKDGLKPLKDWYNTTKTLVAEHLFSNLESQVKGAKGILDALTPTLTRSADALSKFLDDLIADFSTGRMKDLLSPLEVLLPDILSNLLDLIRNLSTGLTGMFAAISPIVEEVTQAIADAAGEWSEWVQSAEGQTAIKDFFADARDAAKALWDIVKNVWDAIKVFFEEGNETGQAFLDKIVQLTKQFAEWLDSPEGREELQQWFQYAKEVASELGDVLSSVRDLFDELNTPTNRELFLILLRGVSGLIDGLTELAGWVERTLQSFTNFGLNLGASASQWGADLVNGFSQGIGNAWSGFLEWWESIWNGLVEWFKGLFGIHSPSTLFAGFGRDILAGLVQGFGEAWGRVTEWWNGTALPFFQSLPERVGAALEAAWDFLWSPISERWAKVTTWWTGTAQPWLTALPGKAESALTKFWSFLFSPISNAWASVTGWWNGSAQPWLNGLPGRAKTQFDKLWNSLPSGITSAWSRVTGWWNGTAMPFFRGLPGKLTSVGEQMINSMLQGIKNVWWTVTNWLSNAVGNIRLTIPTPRISMPSLPWMASGGIANGARVVGIGEAGPEAVVPLNRPLSQVDPSVRWLSAIAQGKAPVNADTGGSGTGVTIAPGAITVQSNFSDSRLVAEDVLSGLVSKFK